MLFANDPSTKLARHDPRVPEPPFSRSAIVSMNALREASSYPADESAPTTSLNAPKYPLSQQSNCTPPRWDSDWDNEFGKGLLHLI
jgi:hypothetical protein